MYCLLPLGGGGGWRGGGWQVAGGVVACTWYIRRASRLTIFVGLWKMHGLPSLEVRHIVTLGAIFSE
jgi:hypothetical protein